MSKLNDEQKEVRDALIGAKSGEVTATVTNDQKAVHIKYDDVSSYFSPEEVRELSMGVTRESDPLTDPLKQFLNHALICAEVVEGEKTVQEAASSADDAVEVSLPE